jgi:hypothetical protein
MKESITSFVGLDVTSQAILELEPDLQRCHARGTEDHGIHADHCAQSETSDLILLVEHIPHVGGGVEPGPCNIVPLDSGVQEGVAANRGVGIQRSDPIGRNVHAAGKVRILKVALRV